MIKAGVRCRMNGIEPEMIWALMVVKDVFDEQGLPLEWSSGVDRTHTDGSLHYVGYGIDVWPGFFIEGKLLDELAGKIRARVGVEFDVVAERVHIHVEFQPKKPLNTEAA